MNEPTNTPNTRRNRSLRFESIILQNEDLRRLIVSSSAEISRSIAKFIKDTFGGPEQFQETLRGCARTFAAIVEAIPKIEERLDAAERSVFERLLDYSWFFDPETDTVTFLKLADFVDAKQESAINRMMVEHFRERLDAIESDLKTKNGRRARILAQAFTAHRERRYALTIPTFLAQADGISRELLGVEYFVSSKSKSRAKALLQEVSGDLFLESALRALVPMGAIRKHTSKKRDGGFHRHAILHGADVDYDSELNSLKAVSLLNFMSTMNDLKQKHLSRQPLTKTP